MKKIFKIFIKKNKKLVAISLIVLVITIFLVFNKKSEVQASDDIKIEENNEIINEEIVENNKQEEIKIDTVKVDIKGEIINPGVYELEIGKRIIDVVNLSGGFTNKAITKSVNLSKKIYDEMVIIIPDKEDVCVVTPNYSVENNNDIKTGLVNINTASLEELLNLTGVGESKAKAIIEYRKTNKFETIEDIMNIAGIKQSLFDKIKDEITI